MKTKFNRKVVSIAKNFITTYESNGRKAALEPWLRLQKLVKGNRKNLIKDVSFLVKHMESFMKGSPDSYLNDLSCSLYYAEDAAWGRKDSPHSRLHEGLRLNAARLK